MVAPLHETFSQLRATDWSQLPARQAWVPGLKKQTRIHTYTTGEVGGRTTSNRRPIYCYYDYHRPSLALFSSSFLLLLLLLSSSAQSIPWTYKYIRTTWCYPRFPLTCPIQCAPSTTSTSPVMKLAAFEQRNTAANAMSAVAPKRPRGIRSETVSTPRGLADSQAVYDNYTNLDRFKTEYEYMLSTDTQTSAIFLSIHLFFALSLPTFTPRILPPILTSHPHAELGEATRARDRPRRDTIAANSTVAPLDRQRPGE